VAPVICAVLAGLALFTAIALFAYWYGHGDGNHHE